VRERLTRPLWLAAVIIAFCVPLFAGLDRTDMENDEAIYSYAVDGILATGDWLNPLSSPHDDAVFLEKPPLKFWIVAAPMALGLAPTTELGMRLWDALFGGLAFLYVFAIGRRLAGPVCGFVAVFVLFVYGPLLFEHGLRNNNMEAPLVLCYCGAVYHYLAWSSAAAPRARRGHVLAVSLYFFLGFMTKFVAACFLPIVLAGATLLERSARARLRHDWKLWSAGAGLFLLLAAPWFIYQQIVAGSQFWQVILGDHVVARMTVSIDPSHIQPWNYYYKTIFRELGYSGTAWLPIVGGALLVGEAIRRRTLDVLLVIAWFALPLALMSLGTSKLHHYAYPFLPPIALSAGYAPGLAVRIGGPYVALAMAWIHRRFIEPRAWKPRVQHVLLALAGAAVLLAAVTLVLGQVQFSVGRTQVFRNSHVFRPLLVALVFAALAGRGVAAGALMLPVAVLIAVLPAPAYEDTLLRLQRQDHPMRTTRDCLMEVRADQLNAGRRPPSIYAVGEQKWMLHSHYYYFRHLGKWERGDTLDDAVVARGLFEPGEQRPILIGDADYLAFKARHGDALLGLPVLRLREALLLMPGPYAVCGQSDHDLGR
jgi:4-amino-4-deoxy-L-arabinose transferase-like glycosyltransferase